MKKQKKYIKPDAEVISFSIPDIITGSIGDDDVPELPNGYTEEEDY